MVFSKNFTKLLFYMSSFKPKDKQTDFMNCHNWDPVYNETDSSTLYTVPL